MAKGLGTIADTAKITARKGGNKAKKAITPAAPTGEVTENEPEIEVIDETLIDPNTVDPSKSVATIGDNNPPVLEHFHPTVSNENEANVGVFKALKSLETTARAVNRQWEALGLSCANVLAFIIARDKNTPTLAMLEKHVNGVLKGKVVAKKDNAGNDILVFEPYNPKVGKPTKTELERRANEKKAYDALPAAVKAAKLQIEQANNILPIGEKTLASAIRPACELAFLLTFGSDANIKIGLETGTTYCKVRRWSHRPKQPVVPFRMFTGENPADAYAMVDDDSKWPADTYVGAGFNDFTLHPMVPVSERPVPRMDKEGKPVINEKTGKPEYIGEMEYRPKSEYAKLPGNEYVDREYIGAVADKVHEHYLRFFGAKGDGQSKLTVIPETGLPPLKAPEPPLKAPERRDSNAGTVNSGVATDLSKYSEPNDANIAELQSMLRAEMAKERTVDLKGATNLEKLTAVKVYVRNLPQKKAGVDAMNTEELSAIQDIYLRIKEWAEKLKVEGFIEAEDEADATAQRLMG